MRQTRKTGIISVVIPVYNTKDYIPRCLESIINNDFRNIEIICINDGSTDDSLKILQNFKKKDDRIIVIDVPNGGVSRARNLGIDRATGEYICFIDPDDWVHFQYFSVFFNCIEKEKADLVACKFDRTSVVNEDKEIDYNNVKTTVFFGQSGLNNHAIKSSVCGRIYRRDFICDQRFSERIRIAEDKVFNMDVFANKPNVRSVIIDVDADLYYYYFREGSAMDTFDGVDFKALSYVYLERMEHIDNPYSASVYLDEAFKNTLSVRYLTSVEKDRKLNNEINEIIHRCLQYEKKYKPFPRKVSLIYRIFSYFPITYWVYRYKTDPTVLDWMKEKRKLN